jgi:hypothetical protein
MCLSAGSRTAVRLLCFVTTVFLVAASADATDYYISAAGHDANAGLSPTQAWRTVQRVSAHQFNPGDRIFFEGGQTFTGNLYLDSADAGTPTAPVTIGSYGTGRATIYAEDGTGILVYNAAGIVIRDLFVVGSGRTTNLGDGIFFFTDLPGDVKLGYIRIDHVDAARFGNYGILVGAHSGSSGYRDVRITHTIASENQMGGIFTYAQNTNVHEDVYVGHSSTFGNSGKGGLLFNSGNGITLSSVNGAVIEHSVAHGNGYLSDAGNGPVGIWAFNSTRVTIQFNESYNNQTGGEKDGGGFCFDLNTSHSVMQYNYSHDNKGAGFQLAHKPDNFAHTNNVIRYNVSENDGRANNYASIQTWGRILNAEIYNNTLFVTPQPSGSVGLARAILIKNQSITLQDPQGLHFRNNIIQTTGGVRLIEAQASALDGAKDIRFEGNAYYSTGGSFRIVWGATTYTSLAAWRAAGQERLNGLDVGLNVNPELLAPNAHIAFNNAGMLPGLYAYRLGADSLLIDAGLDLRTLGVNPGTRDYFGGALPFNGAFDVGAHEYHITCHWAVSPGTLSISDAAGTGTIGVTAADASCGWAAQSSVNWMGISNGEIGSGPGTVDYWVLANTSVSPRTGSIRIADRAFSLTQAAAPGGGDDGGGDGGTSAEVVLHAATAAVVQGKWSVVADSTAAAGGRIQNPNAGAAKIVPALAAPADYFEMTFTAAAGRPYHLWIRGKAASNAWSNDSVYVQFDNSVNVSGTAVYRIGTTQAAEVNIEDCSGCGLSEWGWQDNGYGAGVNGNAVYFATSGTQRIRVQVREDGLGIDQIVLSPAVYLSASPGSLKSDAVILPASDGSGGGTEPDPGDPDPGDPDPGDPDPGDPDPGDPDPSDPDPGDPSGNIVLYALDPATVRGTWSLVSDTTAAGGQRLQNPNAGAAKVTPALASPANYFEMTFTAAAGTPYHLWVRGKAISNNWANDSVHVQFNDSVTVAGAPLARIGTTGSLEVNLEDCSSCGVSGWGWQDNGYGQGVLGQHVYFASSGTHTIRVQIREDGLGIDQIVLSPSTYLSSAPGALKNDATIVGR